jgi:hypothetical protein
MKVAPDLEPNGVSPAILPKRKEPPGRRTLLTVAERIRSERVRWLSRGRIPLRGLTFCAGQKGLGKSIWTNAHIVASLTRGTLPGEMEGTPADVLVLTAEDDWRSVVKPRLQAYGADLERVYRVEVHDEHGPSLFTLPDDVPILEKAIRDLRATGRKMPLLVIDPIGAFVPSGANTHADAPVRRILAPLAQLADELNLAVLIVAHLNKDEAAKLINRITGAGAFVNAARSVLMFVRDPEDPDGEQGMQRLILHAACNWGAYAPTLAAHVEGREIDTDDGDITSVGYLIIDGESPLTVDDVQGSTGPPEHANDTEEAILAFLEDGPRPSIDVKVAVTAKLECSRKTVQRAAVRLSEQGEIEIQSGGFPRRTTWKLVMSALETPQEGHSLPLPSVLTAKNGSTPSIESSLEGQSGHGTGIEKGCPDTNLSDEFDDMIASLSDRVRGMSETPVAEPEDQPEAEPEVEPAPEADPTATDPEEQSESDPDED